MSMNIRIAIVDDMDQDRAQLAHYIEKFKRENKIEIAYDTYLSGADFMKCYKKGLYTLIFLDILMYEQNGLAVARKIRETDARVMIIFTSIAPEFALDGYEVRAYDYIIKPLPYAPVEKVLLETLCGRESLPSFIEVRENRCQIKIMVDDILYVDVDSHYLQIHTVSRIIRTYKRFRDFYPILENYSQFLCCYRNVMVNMNRVKDVNDEDFIMDNDDHVPMRRQAKVELRQLYENYMFDQINQKKFR